VPIYCEPTTALRTGPHQLRLDDLQELERTRNARYGREADGTLVNYVITINFHGFKLLVNKLHGVYMAVDHRYYIAPHTGTAAINLEPGYQLLDGQAGARLRALPGDRLGHLPKRAPATLPRGAQDRLATSLSIFSIPGSSAR